MEIIVETISDGHPVQPEIRKLRPFFFRIRFSGCNRDFCARFRLKSSGFFRIRFFQKFSFFYNFPGYARIRKFTTLNRVLISVYNIIWKSKFGTHATLITPFTEIGLWIHEIKKYEIDRTNEVNVTYCFFILKFLIFIFFAVFTFYNYLIVNFNRNKLKNQIEANISFVSVWIFSGRFNCDDCNN